MSTEYLVLVTSCYVCMLHHTVIFLVHVSICTVVEFLWVLI